MKFIAKLSAVAALAALPGPLLAQATYDADRVITSASLDELIEIVEELGYPFERIEGSPKTLRLVSDKGQPFAISVEYCQGPDLTMCVALQLLIIRSKVPKLSSDMVNELNGRQLVSTIKYDARGERMIESRPIILTGGLTLLNLEANILTFLRMHETLTGLIDEIAAREN